MIIAYLTASPDAVKHFFQNSDPFFKDDAFPFLIIGKASLEDLNGRLAQPLPMNRFRPNLVVSGSAPFAEDEWRQVRMGELELSIVKPCARCVVTTTDQLTGKREKEPLRTLATYRRIDGKVMFEADLGYQIDNLEGLSFHTAKDGTTVLTMISDDNFSILQRTILLQFSLVED